ncbi:MULTISPECIES: type II secretion system secretin GspD [unclassified Pseudomonas]|uniref:type II secretion system secretin GspD n=1 Tax=unclassified Pseudomonas TaxID=196821 RepID=UPI001B332DB9|nr:MULTISPECIES: type II secretion system secretin GspD [unclassified Pseudomonas]MBP5947788.1 type II secretion system secretin GspD [Pseudomonas sp. P9(2020)]MBZ9565741.1 type II secretion system secretin GspD [Pseudomonas sp. P116]
MNNCFPEILRLRSPLLCLATAVALAGCASTPSSTQNDPALMQEALNGTGSQRAPVVDAPADTPGASVSDDVTPARRQIIRGSQNFVRPAAPAAGAKAGAEPGGDIVFNFTDQPIEAVINSVMGDLLHENYSIAQGVKGNVSFSTSKPVNKQQALSILETLLSWTENAMIRQGDRYVILPSNQAVAGKLVPEMPVARPSTGLTARLFPLRYISATEMQKLLKPFARENAFLLVDPARNVLSLAGTPDELANYQDTIDTFDVDWLKGMSIGVYGLQRASVAELMPQLQKLFGPDSGIPLASMVKFMPNERTNSIVAISSQPAYLQEVGDWIATIDEGGGNEPQMYVYDVRNMKASDLAKYLRQIYGNGAIKEDAAAKVAPGLRTASLSSLNGSGNGLSGATSQASAGLGAENNRAQSSGEEEEAEDDSSGGESGDSESADTAESGGQAAEQSLQQSVRITAQKSTNQLLVRTRPAQWKEIESAIKRLDNLPMQVQIETRILEVKLTGELDLGVQWYLGNLAGNSSSTTVANTSGNQGALGAGGAGLGAADSLFYSFVSNNLQVALHALETNGRTQVLSAPSLVVMNNQQAQIQVGDNIPISQTTVNTSNSDTTLSSVEYVQTGVILDVVPRINPGGLVYMDIQQQVSDADTSNVTSSQPNPRISTRSVSTQIAVQSGQTVLLGGLIKQDNAESTSSVPGLSKIPGLKWLFGNTSKSRDRTELIVLITPRVVTSASQARQVTDDYRQQMQLLK